MNVHQPKATLVQAVSPQHMLEWNCVSATLMIGHDQTTSASRQLAVVAHKHAHGFAPQSFLKQASAILAHG